MMPVRVFTFLQCAFRKGTEFSTKTPSVTKITVEILFTIHVCDVSVSSVQSGIYTVNWECNQC